MNDQQHLRDVGLKVTAQRMKILEILTQAEPHHLSAELIYRKLIEQEADVGLATVYRVLAQFEAAGLVLRHQFADGYAVFEMAGEEHHDHLVCLNCGAVTEFVDEVIEARQEDICKVHGYQMSDHQMTIYGVCDKCG